MGFGDGEVRRKGMVVAVCAGKLGGNQWNMPSLNLSAND